MLEAVIEHHREIIAQAQHELDTVGGRHHGDRPSASELIREHTPLLEALEKAQRAIDDDHPLWLHRKRGSIYSEVGVLVVQSDRPIHDNDELVLYRSRDGLWFGRPEDEFRDGRFAEVEPAADTPPLDAAFPPEFIRPKHKDGCSVVLITGEDDDTHVHFTKEAWERTVGKIANHQPFEIGPDDIKSEDYWGTWKLVEALNPVSPDKYPRLLVKRV